MGLCGSRPVGAEGSSAAAVLHGATPAPGSVSPAKQAHTKAPTTSGTDQQPLLGAESGGQGGSPTITPVQEFVEQDSMSLDPHISAHNNGGTGPVVASRFFKRNGQPQGAPGTASDAGVFTTRSGGGSPQSNGSPAATPIPPQAAVAAAAAAAAAAATATAAATAATATATAATATATVTVNGVYATGANGLAAGGPGAVSTWRPYPPAVSRCEAVAQTDASLLYPLFRDPGPTVPVRWRKGEGIGSGSFGQVYLALNCDTGELLAVKEVPAGLADLGAGGGGGGRGSAAEAVAQLEREVALLSQLRHPNIVRYVGTQRSGLAAAAAAVAGGGGGPGGAGAPLYIFLEYVPGGSLSSQLSRFGPLPEPLVALYTRQLLLGLAYLHAQRTVHRDVKGANLLLEKTGVLKLADFGMAKQLMEQVSFTRSFKGSAYWMAPEVIKQQGYGVQADIWSVGCTVLEMATGKPPWSQCTSQVQAIFKIASSPDLPSIPEHLSPQASEFILLCLQRDPSARPTAEELLRHPFVTSPLSANPLPPALADPLAALFPDPLMRNFPSAMASSAVRCSGSMTLMGSGGDGGGGGGGSGSVGGSLSMAMGLTPLRLGRGQSAAAGNGGRGGGSVTSTPAAAAAAAGAAWSPFGGMMLNPAAAAAAAAAAAGAATGATPSAAAAGAQASPFALGQYGSGGGAEMLGSSGGGGGGLSEDHLAALVLGNSVHISKAARAAQAMAADEEREADDDTHIDFTTQPQLFRVRGLLTLPPLKMLHAQQLPPLTVQTQTLRHDPYGVSGGGGGDHAGGGLTHGSLR